MEIEDIKILKTLYNELYELLNIWPSYEIDNIEFNSESDTITVTYLYPVWGGEYEYKTYDIPFEYLKNKETAEKYMDDEDEKKRIQKLEEEKKREQDIKDCRRRLYEKLKKEFE